MFPARFLRRRWVLAVIFIFSLGYFINSTFNQADPIGVISDRFEDLPHTTLQLQLRSRVEVIDKNNSVSCLNSKQGHTLVVDNRGFVCPRKAVLVNNCCDPESESSVLYSCGSCRDDTNCCSIYEDCVSCCMHPEKEALLQGVLGVEEMEGKTGLTLPQEGRLSEHSRHHPFNLHWLDSALHETLLPGSPWEQVHASVSEKLAQSLESDLSTDDDSRQIIMQLLGPLFINRYMKNVLQDPNFQDPNDMNAIDAEAKKNHLHSAQLLLREKLDHAIKELGYLPPPSSSTSSTPLPQEQRDERDQGMTEMNGFLDYARKIFKNGLERELVNAERSAKKANSEESRGLKLSSSTSDHLGKSLHVILQRDPSRLDEVCRRISGQQLPVTLRGYLWAEILLRMVEDVGGSKDKPSEKMTRKRFAKAVSKGKVDLKTTRATECPIGGLIETAVNEKFDITPCMEAYRMDKVCAQAREALNVLYTYNRSYEPFLIAWLFPLQLAFQDGQQKEEHPYELALYLNLLQTHAFPKWPEVFAIAEQAMARLQATDGDLYNHLQECALKNVKLDPKEFLVHLIGAEKRKAAALSWSTNANDAETATSKELLANPIMFLRKWIGEGFVSVLKTPAVMYVWDQCFTSGWNRLVLEDVCLALLILLKDKFLKAVDYHQMRQVFLSEPFHVLTLDLVRTYQDIQAGKTPTAEVNRKTPQTREPSALKPAQEPQAEDLAEAPSQEEAIQPIEQASEAPSEALEPEPELEPELQLEPEPEPHEEHIKLSKAGLKNIDLKLKWNLTTSQLADFQTEKLFVTVSLVLNGKTLQTKDCESVFVSSFATDGQSDTIEASTAQTTPKHRVAVPVPQQVVFDEVDTLEVVEHGSIAEPHVVLSIQYGTTPGEGEEDIKNSIGWALIPVYQKKPVTPPDGRDSWASADGEVAQTSTWLFSEGEQTVPLYFGEVPEDVTAEGAKKEFPEEDILRVGSEIIVTVFDGEELPETTENEEPPPPTAIEEEPEVDEDPDPAWVKHDPSKAEPLSPFPAAQGFDLYIDEVRFLPDNATICKVTGRVLLPVAKTRSDIAAFSLLDTSARCPKFHYCYNVPTAEVTNLAVLRVYTVDRVTGTVAVIGASILSLYSDDSNQLKLGGYQLRVHAGMPKIEELSAEAMSKFPSIPGCTILIRLLPKSEEFIPAPEYTSGYYQSDTSEPTASEHRILKHFKKSKTTPETVRIALQNIREKMNVTDVMTDDGLIEWAMDRLNHKKWSSDPSKPPERLDLVRCVNYDVDQGVCVTVNSAKAIKGEGKYTNIVGRVVPGGDTKKVPPSELERFLVQGVKSTSLQTAPSFQNEPQKIYPVYSTKSALVFQVIGLTIKYKMDPSGEGPGSVTDNDGTSPVSLTEDARLGWCVLPLFNKDCVAQGMYILPIFKDDGNLSFLKEMSEAPDLYGWMVSAISRRTITLDGSFSSLVVTLWDGHFEKGETIPLPNEDKFLNVNDSKKFAAAAEETKGQPISDLIIQTPPTEDGALSEAYWEEEAKFQEVMKKTFRDIIDKMFEQENPSHQE